MKSPTHIPASSFSMLLMVLLLPPAAQAAAAAGESGAQESKETEGGEAADVEEIKEEDVTEILDSESDAEDEELGAPKKEGKEPEKKKTEAPAAGVSKPEKFSDETLSEEGSIDWDASFRKEFEGEENEVVTPSGREEDIFLAIPAAAVITKQSMFETNADSLSVAAEKAPGLFLASIQDFSPSPVMRGLFGSRVQLLFDGIRLNTASAPSGMSYLPGLADIPSLDSIELVGGPSIVRYGTGALGGVINFIPPLPMINPFVAKATDATAFFRYSTLDSSFTGHADTSLHTSDMGLYAGVTYSDHGSLTSGKDKQPFTGFNKIAVSFMAARQFLDSHQIKFGYFFTRDMEADRQLLLGQDLLDPEAGEPGKETVRDYINWDHFERHLLFLRYTGEDIAALDKLQFTAGAQIFREKINVELINFLVSPRISKDRITTGSFFGLFSLGASLGGWGYLTYGFDYYADRLSTKAFIKENLSPDVSVTYPAERGIFEDGALSSSFEHYAQLELYALRPLVITAGGRAVWNYVDIGMRRQSNLVGGGAQLELRIPIGGRIKSTKIVTLSDILAFDVIASYASRPPTLDELSAVRMVPEGILYGNPDLGNEQVVGAQGGLKWNAGLIEGQLFYGYSHFESMILPKQAYDEMAGYPYDYDLCTYGILCWIDTNAGKADLHSVEMVNRFNIKNFMVIGLLLNYTYGQQEAMFGDVEPMSDIPPLSGAVWIRGMYTTYGLWGELQLRWGWKQTNLSTRDMADRGICGASGGCAGTDGFLLLSFRGGVKITNRYFLSFAFTNLINRMVKMHGSALYEPGIGASVSFEARL